jgi:hypothetical protein
LSGREFTCLSTAPAHPRFGRLAFDNKAAELADAATVARLESANLAAAFNNEIALRLDTLAATMNFIASEMRA